MLHHLSNEHSSLTPGSSSQSILFVNSNDIIREQVKKATIQANHFFSGCVQTVHNLEDAIVTMNPDLIIVNLSTKGKFDGYQLTKLIKLDYEIPFYVLYNESDKKEKKWAKELNPDGFILYSPNLDLLSFRLKEVIS